MGLIKVILLCTYFQIFSWPSFRPAWLFLCYSQYFNSFLLEWRRLPFSRVMGYQLIIPVASTHRRYQDQYQKPILVRPHIDLVYAYSLKLFKSLVILRLENLETSNLALILKMDDEWQLLHVLVNKHLNKMYLVTMHLFKTFGRSQFCSVLLHFGCKSLILVCPKILTYVVKSDRRSWPESTSPLLPTQC